MNYTKLPEVFYSFVFLLSTNSIFITLRGWVRTPADVSRLPQESVGAAKMHYLVSALPLNIKAVVMVNIRFAAGNGDVISGKFGVEV